MKLLLKNLNTTSKEVFFQIMLHLVLFVFFIFDRHQPRFEMHKIMFFANYTLAAFIINYILLPRFYYQKKYYSFLVLLIITITLVMITEEFLLEKIFFPNDEGKNFSGVFFSLLDILPVISILSGFKFAFDATKKQHELDVLRAYAKESELQFLKSQINPHFLFNNLNNLYAYAIENSSKTPTIILEISSVLRYMLYDCKENFVPLSKELEHLKNFTALNELQIEDRGIISFITENIRKGYKIAPLILMVFIENAFKHSTASQSDKILIDVSINLTTTGELEFLCKNTFSKNTNTDNLSHGIGLANVKKRLDLLYPNVYRLYIIENTNEFIVNLTMQLKAETE